MFNNNNNNNNNEGKGNIAHEERVTLLSFDADVPTTKVAAEGHSPHKAVEPNADEQGVPKDGPKDAESAKGEEQPAIQEEPNQASEEAKPPVNESGASDTSSSSEVVKIELTTELLIDDGSQELFRIYHNNSAIVQDQPRDLGIPPVEYPPVHIEPTLITAVTTTESPSLPPRSNECCCMIDEVVQIVLTSDGEGTHSASGAVVYTSELDGESYTYQGTVEWFGQSTSGSPITSNTFEFSLSYTNCEFESSEGSESSGSFKESYLTLTYSHEQGSSSVTDIFTFFAPSLDCDCNYTLHFDEAGFVNEILQSNAYFGPISATNFINFLQDTSYFTDCEGNSYFWYQSGIYESSATAPVVLDLTGHGINLTSVQDGVAYDMNQDGQKGATSWIGEGNGFLIYDENQDHTVTNASEFILTSFVPEAKTDLEALRLGFDSNNDKIFSADDAKWNQFGVWEDKNHDGVVDKGEYNTLDQLGISSIDLVSDNNVHMDNGNIVNGISSFTYADGSKGAVADVALRTEDVLQSTSQVDTLLAANDASSSHAPSSQSASSSPQDAASAPVAAVDTVTQSTLEQVAQQAAVAAVT
ncbi:hypothetical protein [Candidatus Berkiella aquae]|uniref:EF-hand domain-containing protein n=1 Tax=Candidatus Berkiella aquae TaxID=295108 RepID=A0A0Q9YV21_9GAMM|nr:hypothetical protein [Candidatus Berkiella aquae]MCS5710890.1 hypothetical protein [Candidatus Berkiella aquae]